MKSCWLVILPGYKFSMVSTEKLTHAQALEVVLSLWPDALGVQ